MEQQYISIWNEALALDYRRFLQEIKNVFDLIVETGTSRGFSAVCMAKALNDEGIAGKIVTFDINLTNNSNPGEQIDVRNKRILWNCIRDARGPSTRYELLDKWTDLVDKYIQFIDGDSIVTLPKFLSSVSRVHFAFLDANHSYETVSREIGQVYPLQVAGDIIVCDDYTQGQFPGIVKAVDQHITVNTPITHKFFYPHGPKREWLRGYVYMVKR